jgi:DnaJ-class molecular chaperone
MAVGFKDYYEILGVPRTATQKEIKAAFRKLARQYHPDVNPGDPSAEQRFKEINEANEVLSDPEKRRVYDEAGPVWQEAQQGRPGPSPFGAGQGPQVEYRSVSPEDLEDLFGDANPFSDFFYDLFGSRRGGGGGTRSPRTRRGEDVEGEVDVSLEEAFRGTTRTVDLAEPGGTRRIEVRIPPGITDAARVRAAGQGGRGSGAGSSGDLFIRVHVRPHPLFRREGDDLYARVPVPLDVALLGSEVEVPTPKGTRAKVTVPAGTQNGARLRLRGLGMPHLRGGGNGDLYAEVDVRLPSALTPEVRAFAEALRGTKETAHAV